MNSNLRNYTSKLLVVGIMLSILPTHTQAKTGQKVGRQTYDYIVIGSDAGAVVANRLSDDRKTSVLVLEAGDRNNTADYLTDSTQALSVYALHNPEVVYQGQTTTGQSPVAVAQDDFALDGHFDFLNARILGGSSSINNEQVVFGTSTFWDTKVASVGGDDWSSANVYARYKDLESYLNETGDSGETRGSEGPWKNATVPATLTADAQALLDALNDAEFNTTGAAEITDYNTPDPVNNVGVFARWDMQQQFDLANFPRETTVDAFLADAVVDRAAADKERCRKLTVRTRSTAVALIWDEDCPTKVIGVRYTRDGVSHEVYARKEVIVAAGLLTAPFLQRNGIGPVSVLENAGVEVRVASEEVGKHIRNHIGVPAVFSAANSGGVNLIPENEPWAIFAPGAFLANATEPGEESIRAIQWNFADLRQTGSPDFIQALPIILAPASEGTINIQSADPLKVPLFETGYLTDPADVTSLINTLTGGEGTISAPSIRSLQTAFTNSTGWELVSPTIEMLNFADPVELEEFINDNLMQLPDYTGGAVMGTNIGNGVVDNHGKVFGVRGLRVADLSILPYIPDGSNTTTPAILVGWSIAEFIKAGN